MHVHQQAITCCIENGSDMHFIVTVVCGKNKPEERHALWSHLVYLKSLITSPWLILGDFNSIRTVNERLGSSDFDFRAMEEFHQCIHQLDVEEFSGRVFYFTWCNQRDNGYRIYSKIDKRLYK
ncbi:hypothetical protein ACH5RR_003094 [Cinchona calisaya]|uniref:Uncharacterized protein n=1 Tax=Cinchona calisaya TaxID=153742 RepID=A0ABD3AU79_9GENT